MDLSVCLHVFGCVSVEMCWHVYGLLRCKRRQCVQCILANMCMKMFHIDVFILRCVFMCVFSLDRGHIQIKNMLTRHSGRSNCWFGGLRVWGGGRLIAGDYKPQSSSLVSGFD